jgi:adenosine deaminase
MPKAELHLHLDGSLRIETALDLARTRGVDAPRDVEGMRRELVAPMPCRDQAELLRAFRLPIELMQDAEALERIARELVETKAAEGVRYLEIRWAPALHTARGLSPADVIEAVARGANDAARTAGVESRLICTAMRSHDPEANVRWPRPPSARGTRHDRMGPRGPEEAFPDPTAPRRRVRRRPRGRPPDHRPRRRVGRRRPGPRALAVEPERIAHGPAPIDDPDLCRELIARNVPLDVCPTSNWQAGIVPSIAAHPARPPPPRRRPVTLSTDDTTVSDLSLTDEYERALDEIGLTVDELWAIDRAALDHAFVDAATARASRPPSTPGRRRPEASAGRGRSRIAPSSAASAAIAVGWRSGGAASTSARVVTPVSIRTLRAPTATAAAMSVPSPSPIITASVGSRPTRRAASSSRYGSGLPIEIGVTPLAASIAATIEPAPGRTARSVG